MDVRGYDSLDDMFADMAAAQKAANDGLNGAQRELRDDFEHDRHWILNNGDYLVFGVAWSHRTYLDRIAASVTEGLTDLNAEEMDEFRFEAAIFPENRMAGYLTGENWSCVFPRGALEDAHVSQVMPISPVAFNEAREAGWKIDADLAPTLLAECIAIQEYVLLVQKGVTE